MSPDLINSLIQAGATLGAVYLAYRYAVQQLHQQTQVQIQQDLNRRRADALQQVWPLLAYMSMTENQHSLLRWERDKQAKPALNRYYLRLNPARAFVQQVLPTAFYEQQLGLYLSPAIKERLFEYRSQLYGVLLKHTDSSDIEIPLENPQLWQRLQQLYEELNTLLRQEMAAIYQTKL